MDNASVKEELRQYILTEFLPGEKASNLLDDTPLRTGGVLDSVANLTLVTHVEEHYHIEVEAHEAGVENFDTINRIAALIQSKGGVAS
jgi:acyl carrier protein